MPPGTPQNHRLPPLNALRSFEAAARHLSFKNAARELHVTPRAVSHQVKLLEESLGIPLFRRLTRALELTPEGQALLPKLQEGLRSLAEAVERVRSRSDARTLTVMAPPHFAVRWLVPRLARFTESHPDLDLTVASRTSMIDGRDDSELDPSPDGSEVAPLAMIRYGEGRTHWYVSRCPAPTPCWATYWLPASTRLWVEMPVAVLAPKPIRAYTSGLVALRISAHRMPRMPTAG